MIKKAKFNIGQVVRHRHYDFRGVVYDVDPTFSNTEQWYQSIPEAIRPEKDQPYYHLFAENNKSSYEAYVSEQNLLLDESPRPVGHPAIEHAFKRDQQGLYHLRVQLGH